MTETAGDKNKNHKNAEFEIESQRLSELMKCRDRIAPKLKKVLMRRDRAKQKMNYTIEDVQDLFPDEERDAVKQVILAPSLKPIWLDSYISYYRAYYRPEVYCYNKQKDVQEQNNRSIAERNTGGNKFGLWLGLLLLIITILILGHAI